MVANDQTLLREFLLDVGLPDYESEEAVEDLVKWRFSPPVQALWQTISSLPSSSAPTLTFHNLTIGADGRLTKLVDDSSTLRSAAPAALSSSAASQAETVPGTAMAPTSLYPSRGPELSRLLQLAQAATDRSEYERANEALGSAGSILSTLFAEDKARHDAATGFNLLANSATSTAAWEAAESLLELFNRLSSTTAAGSNAHTIASDTQSHPYSSRQ